MSSERRLSSSLASSSSDCSLIEVARVETIGFGEVREWGISDVESENDLRLDLVGFGGIGNLSNGPDGWIGLVSMNECAASEFPSEMTLSGFADVSSSISPILSQPLTGSIFKTGRSGRSPFVFFVGFSKFCSWLVMFKLSAEERSIDFLKFRRPAELGGVGKGFSSRLTSL